MAEQIKATLKMARLSKGRAFGDSYGNPEVRDGVFDSTPPIVEHLTGGVVRCQGGDLYRLEMAPEDPK